jgi:hypothetical protein
MVQRFSPLFDASVHAQRTPWRPFTRLKSGSVASSSGTRPATNKKETESGGTPSSDHWLSHTSFAELGQIIDATGR